jgi:hypothetical protein
MVRSVVLTYALLVAVPAFCADPQQLHVVSLSGSVPAVRHDPDDSRYEALCRGDSRSAEAPEEKAAYEAGFAPQQIGPTRVIIAASSMDSSCRPQGLTVLVFTSGRAVGMVSTRDRVAVPTVQLNDSKTLVVSADIKFRGDANCCATGKAKVVVGIRENDIGAK